MPSSIPEHKIQEVLDATDIVDLVSNYLTLKKKGSNFFGLCPFHQEKTGSFSVSPPKQIFHCFGCGAGGNAFIYMMRQEGLSFPEAVKFLANRAGITLEYDSEDESVGKAKEALYYANEFAADFFKRALLGQEGKSALAYLEGRGYKTEEIKTFGLGYALPAWDGLISHAKAEKVDLELLSQAGLVLQKTSRDYYDRFRNRVMFSIWNLSGRIVGFGGRILTEEEKSPKYMNSPETAVYEKGKMLYGLYQNREAIRQSEQAIFVEGYTDLMSLVSAGVKNVAATLGTALTEDQARLIRRYTKRVVLMYDSDTAGTAATLRGADILLANGLDVAIATLPAGEDPDSFVKRKGAEAVLAGVETAPSLIDFKLQQLVQQPPEKRNDSIRSLLESLSRLGDNIQRSLQLRKVSEMLGLEERMLWGELQEMMQHQKRGRSTSKVSQRLNELSQTRKVSKIDAAVEDLVRIVIDRWDLAEVVFNKLDLSSISESQMAPVLLYLNNRFKANRRPNESDLVNSLVDVDVTSFVVKAFNNPMQKKQVSLDFHKWALDCIQVIQKERIQEKLNAIRAEIRQAQEQGRPVKNLLHDCVALEEEKKRLEEDNDLVLN